MKLSPISKVALMAAAVGVNIGEVLDRPMSEAKSKSYMPHQGKREIERRRKQMQKQARG